MSNASVLAMLRSHNSQLLEVHNGNSGWKQHQFRCSFSQEEGCMSEVIK